MNNSFLPSHKNPLFVLPILIFASIIFLGAACTRSRSDGGMMKSEDGGVTWSSQAQLRNSDRQGSIANYDMTEITIDPVDPQRIYGGTWNNGALISENGGGEWQPFLKRSGTVRSILIHPRDTKQLLAALPDQLIRSRDRGETWQTVYPAPTGDVTIQSIALGGNDGRSLYLGLSNGDLLRSDTIGESWTRVFGFEDRIERVLANQNDGNIVYVATTRRGLWKSTDGGTSWNRFSDQPAWKDINPVRTFRAMTLDPTVFDGLLYTSTYGIVRTRDGGVTWASIGVLEAPGNFSATALAVHPRDSATIAYGTRQGIFITTDNGTSWKTVSLNSERTPMSIVYQRTKPSTMYVGLAK